MRADRPIPERVKSKPRLTTPIAWKNNAPSQRSQTPLLHRRRSGVGFSDPESALWCVFVQGWAGSSRWRRDRRLRARSVGARTGRPAGCRRARDVRGAGAQSVHGAGAQSVVAHPGADQRIAAPRPSGTARQSRAARARAGADGRRQIAFADRGRRVHRFLFVEGARHQCRHHVPRQIQSAAAELAAYPDRLQRPRVDRRGQRHQGAPSARPVEAAECGIAELRSLQATGFRAGNGRRDRPALADGRDAHRATGRGHDLRLYAA